ncbi:MAG: hypothetical protein AB1420_05810 [Bacillota bacterium]
MSEGIKIASTVVDPVENVLLIKVLDMNDDIVSAIQEKVNHPGVKVVPGNKLILQSKP